VSFAADCARHLRLLAAGWVLTASFATAAPKPATDILVLYSNSRLLPANVEIDRGLHEVIENRSDLNVRLFTEFLDEPSFSGAAYEHTVALYLQEKYSARPPSVVVVAGEEGLGFLLRHRAELFEQVPVVHLAVAREVLLANEPLPDGFVGSDAGYDPLGTIRLALRLHPDTRRVIIITGVSEMDRVGAVTLRKRIPELKLDQEVEFIEGLSTDDVLKRLAALGEGDVVYTPGYFRDGAGREFAPRESAVLMAAASGAPIYAPYNTFLGTGIVGGRMPSFYEMGRQAALTVNGLLDGIVPAALQIPASSKSFVAVDWRQVVRWGIDPAAVPADAVVHFREPSFWEAHRGQAIAIAGVIVVQALFIAALLIERRHRRRTAAELRESQVQMSLAARTARLSVLTWDISRDAGTHAGTRMPSREAGASRIPLHLVLESVHPADRERFERAVWQAVDREEELEVEYRSLRPNGEVQWIVARGRAEQAGGTLSGIATDVTARKNAEQQAEKDRSALTHMSRVSTMGQLSVSIAHQLNQPLAAILGNAEAARKMLGHDVPDIPELKEICDDIIAENKRATEVIRRLGALYRRGELKVAPVNLNELVDETLDLVRTELMSRHVVARTHLAPSPLIVDGGRVQLQQVLLNLVLNAADAMSELAAEQRHLEIATEIDGPNVLLRVVDHGTGIATENLKNVFEAFWSSKPGGIGVGLAICLSIVAAHHGTLTASNNPDGGATFCATWPVRQPS
jgi:signal transduction histidine kinase